MLPDNCIRIQAAFGLRVPCATVKNKNPGKGWPYSSSAAVRLCVPNLLAADVFYRSFPQPRWIFHILSSFYISHLWSKIKSTSKYLAWIDFVHTNHNRKGKLFTKILLQKILADAKFWTCDLPTLGSWCLPRPDHSRVDLKGHLPLVIAKWKYMLCFQGHNKHGRNLQGASQD